MSATVPSRLTPASTYARFAPYVRRRLAGFGVRDADLPDLCQEVFLVVHAKRHVLPAVDRIDLWLREICRRVAAGYRRRAGHRFEVLGCDAAERPDPASDVADEPDVATQLALLRRALNHLDDESRDLLALHDAGDMPLTDLARLVAHDRKTVRSRLARARHRVSRWMRGDGPGVAAGAASAPRMTPAASPFFRDQAARGRAVGCAAQELEIIRFTPEHCSGTLGNVTIADWRGPQIEAETIESALRQAAPHALERCGGEIAYLALIEPTLQPPTLEARQKIVDAFETMGPYLNSFAVVLLGENGRINRPILQGLVLLARPRFPMRFFSSVQAAADWLCETVARGCAGPLVPCELAAAAEQMRQVGAAAANDERRRVRSFPVVPS
jgi:RNA polymerase sigma-70 factor (ECF subfamily)